MNFATPAFLIFLTVVFAGSFLLRSPQQRKILVLIASYIFYATWNIPFISLILLSTSIDYFLSKKIACTDEVAKRKLLLTLGISINLTILGVFKYFNFFTTSINQVSGALFHHPHVFNLMNILLPLGISFYTFEAIGYLVDVYRGDKPAKNFYDYNFYIMFFPHLISGPIVRYHELAPQISDGIKLPTAETLRKGFELIVLGLVYKLLIADTVSTLADPVFGNIGGANTLCTYVACLAFSTQIYFDFMGYTHIARGVSLLFNVALPLNFNHPYNVTNISMLWRHWHMSLSRWIRDYLFIPLGGSRAGAARTCFNLFVTMVIAGAWHGAGWTYIVFGMYHGILLAGYYLLKPALAKLGHIREATAYKVAGCALTFSLWTLGLVCFRSPDFATAIAFYQKLANVGSLWSEMLGGIKHGDYVFVATMAMLSLLCFSGPLVVSLYNKVSIEIPYWMKVQAATVAIILCFVFAGSEIRPFIYFQF